VLLSPFLFSCCFRDITQTKKTCKFCYFWWNDLYFFYNISLNYLLSHSTYFDLCNKYLRVLLTKQYLMLRWTLKTIYQAVAYYYHGLILDEGNTEKSHGMAVAALQAADEYFKESKKLCEAFNTAPPLSRLSIVFPFIQCYAIICSQNRFLLYANCANVHDTSRGIIMTLECTWNLCDCACKITIVLFLL